ncbi:hypothetical protein [Flavobacterium beibuense]|uniref:Uncharacterized protein n=1 Tax=Flavobacterium beibuense TaxID=657326 RepID=A0A444WGY0_9FLAO|nr:hypothetical protein [Flavobacterium beibuense]RYJ45118.1 hypothetical protein NU09_0752 [Flavobacterium beibuense]
MKKVILTMGLLCLISSGYGQSLQLPTVDPVTLESLPAAVSRSIELKEFEKAALQASDFIIASPVNEVNDEKVKASKGYLLGWMQDSPDFNFAVDHTIAVFEDNDPLMWIYMACMAKYTIEHKEQSGNTDYIKLGTWELVAGYIDNPDNRVAKTEKLNMLCNAYRSGELDAFLKSL